MTLRQVAAWAVMALGAAVVVSVTWSWVSDGVPDGWWERITGPIWVLLGVQLVGAGRNWLRLLRTHPEARLKDAWGGTRPPSRG